MQRLSDIVFEFIQSQGVSKVFLLPGGGAMHLVDALSRRKNIEFVPVHHEQSAGIAACTVSPTETISGKSKETSVLVTTVLEVLLYQIEDQKNHYPVML